MKTKTIITELTQEDLVNLLCTATYGSNWLDCSAPDRRGIIVDDNDCREDVWAKCLLAGNTIKCTDYYAEGESYGNLPCTIDEDENAEYTLSLQDIKDGLQRCADGTFIDADNDQAREFLHKCFYSFADEESGDFDEERAATLMQIILFNELIYG